MWGVLEIDGIDLCSNASSNFGRYQWRVGFGHRFCLVMMLGFLCFYCHFMTIDEGIMCMCVRQLSDIFGRSLLRFSHGFWPVMVLNIFCASSNIL